ncbi:AmmeMemoRadiSam system protein B [Candidatus Woesearchaeota archaeon]|nr:AmmeMemoRadiSam system protein B [Candidatus Woesearchaeota archaeon]
MAREPIVAGQFYEDERLKEQLEECFSGVEVSENKNLKACISPHAGFVFSGKCAAHSFSNMPKAETYVILGPSHEGNANSVSYADWKTPLGILKNDIEFSKKLKIKNNEDAHKHEHSIEVQLPFLQHVHPDAKIVPILVSDHPGIAEEIARVAKEMGRSVIVIASSDFTHYGPVYNYVPFRINAKEKLYKLDRGAIDFILKFDAAGFLGYIGENGATICGKEPITALIEYCKLAGIKKSKLLKYYTSGDIFGDYSAAVGYASIGFY